jgi:HAE1 family hydrophobic/amphiphilic exporter-1
MAVGFPSRSITWAPMATPFVAGLSSATLLTLLVTPANYELFENAKAWLRRRRGTGPPGRAENWGGEGA